MSTPDLSGSLTEDQIREGFRAVLGMEPREADVSVVSSLGGTRAVLADYLWDHWLGEPEDLEVETIQTWIDVALGIVSPDPRDSE